MIGLPKPSPIFASLAGLFAGVSFTVIRLSYQMLGEGGLSELITLVLGGIAFLLAFASISGFGRLLKRPGWEPVLRWYLHAFLFCACTIATTVIIEKTLIPAIKVSAQ